jgi:hypothetical protein
MGHLVERPAIVTGLETRGRVLVVVTTAHLKNTPDGVDRVIMFREVLSLFRPLVGVPTAAVPVNLDAKLALIFSEIQSDQNIKANRALDFIDDEGFLAFDMATGRVVPGAEPIVSQSIAHLPLP